MMRSTVSARSLMLLPGTISAVRWWLRFTYSRLADLCSSGPNRRFSTQAMRPQRRASTHTPCPAGFRFLQCSLRLRHWESSLAQIPRLYVASTCTNALGLCRPFRPVRPGGASTTQGWVARATQGANAQVAAFSHL